MKRVAISGAGGKLATPIAEAVAHTDDLDLVGLFNPNRAGSELMGVTITDDASEIETDVMIETAHPDVVFENISVWKQMGFDLVVGTSGFTPERLDRLANDWGQESPCLVVPNFAIGAVLMMKYAREAASQFEAIEVVERHHSTKPDAPSGTALATAMGVAAGGGSSAGASEELVPGARGANVEGVQVHAVRLPGLISHQEVLMSNPGEVFTLEHLSTSYESFAAGAVLAARRVGSLTGGVHVGLDTVLS